MNVFEAIIARRAVKAYDANFVIPPQDEKKLFDIVRHSPTAFNLQNWRFVVVKDKALREQIRKVAKNQEQVTHASLLVILCADLNAWAKHPERYWSDSPTEVQNIMTPMIHDFYSGRKQVQRDEAMRSVGMAAQTLMMTSKALGYDSCPMIGFDPDAVGALINLPEDHVIGMFLAIGKGVSPARPKGGFLPQSDVFIENRFCTREFSVT